MGLAKMLTVQRCISTAATSEEEQTGINKQLIPDKNTDDTALFYHSIPQDDDRELS